MTPSGPGDLRESVTGLCSALTRLDHGAVESHCSELEALSASLGEGGIRPTPAEAEKLFGDLKRARLLAEHAGRLYAGWARIAALDGAVYGASGQEVTAPVAKALICQG